GARAFPPRSAAARRRAASRRLRARPQCPARTPRCWRVERSFHLDLIVLDQRIGEELVGRLLERGLRRFAIASLDLDVEDLALAHARNAGDAERFERAFDRLALGIEDAGFEGDGDAGLHRGSANIDMARIGYTASGGRAYPRPIARGARARGLKFRHKPLQCTGAAVDCSRSRPRPATRPLSPTSRSAAQNAACVLATTGIPCRCSSGFATPKVRSPPHPISNPSAAGAATQTLEPSAIMSASLLVSGSPKPNRPKPSSASTSKPFAMRKACRRLFTSSA